VAALSDAETWAQGADADGVAAHLDQPGVRVSTREVHALLAAWETQGCEEVHDWAAAVRRNPLAAAAVDPRIFNRALDALHRDDESVATLLQPLLAVWLSVGGGSLSCHTYSSRALILQAAAAQLRLAVSASNPAARGSGTPLGGDDDTTRASVRAASTAVAMQSAAAQWQRAAAGVTAVTRLWLTSAFGNCGEMGAAIVHGLTATPLRPAAAVLAPVVTAEEEAAALEAPAPLDAAASVGAFLRHALTATPLAEVTPRTCVRNGDQGRQQVALPLHASQAAAPALAALEGVPPPSHVDGSASAPSLAALLFAAYALLADAADAADAAAVANSTGSGDGEPNTVPAGLFQSPALLAHTLPALRILAGLLQGDNEAVNECQSPAAPPRGRTPATSRSLLSPSRGASAPPSPGTAADGTPGRRSTSVTPSRSGSSVSAPPFAKAIVVGSPEWALQAAAAAADASGLIAAAPSPAALAAALDAAAGVAQDAVAAALCGDDAHAVVVSQAGADALDTIVQLQPHAAPTSADAVSSSVGCGLFNHAGSHVAVAVLALLAKHAQAYLAAHMALPDDEMALLTGMNLPSQRLPPQVRAILKAAGSDDGAGGTVATHYLPPQPTVTSLLLLRVLSAHVHRFLIAAGPADGVTALLASAAASSLATIQRALVHAAERRGLHGGPGFGGPVNNANAAALAAVGGTRDPWVPSSQEWSRLLSVLPPPPAPLAPQSEGDTQAAASGGSATPAPQRTDPSALLTPFWRARVGGAAAGTIRGPPSSPGLSALARLTGTPKLSALNPALVRTSSKDVTASPAAMGGADGVGVVQLQRGADTPALGDMPDLDLSAGGVEATPAPETGSAASPTGGTGGGGGGGAAEDAGDGTVMGSLMTALATQVTQHVQDLHAWVRALPAGAEWGLGRVAAQPDALTESELRDKVAVAARVSALTAAPAARSPGIMSMATGGTRGTSAVPGPFSAAPPPPPVPKPLRRVAHPRRGAEDGDGDGEGSEPEPEADEEDDVSRPAPSPASQDADDTSDVDMGTPALHAAASRKAAPPGFAAPSPAPVPAPAPVGVPGLAAQVVLTMVGQITVCVNAVIVTAARALAAGVRITHTTPWLLHDAAHRTLTAACREGPLTISHQHPNPYRLPSGTWCLAPLFAALTPVNRLAVEFARVLAASPDLAHLVVLSAVPAGAMLLEGYRVADVIAASTLAGDVPSVAVAEALIARDAAILDALWQLAGAEAGGSERIVASSRAADVPCTRALRAVVHGLMRPWWRLPGTCLEEEASEYADAATRGMLTSLHVAAQVQSPASDVPSPTGPAPAAPAGKRPNASSRLHSILRAGGSGDTDNADALLLEPAIASAVPTPMHGVVDVSDLADAVAVATLHQKALRADPSAIPAKATVALPFHLPIMPFGLPTPPTEREHTLSWDEARCNESITVTSAGGPSASARCSMTRTWGTCLANRGFAPNTGVHGASRVESRCVACARRRTIASPPPPSTPTPDAAWEITMTRTQGGHVFVGVATRQAALSSHLGGDVHGWGMQMSGECAVVDPALCC